MGRAAQKRGENTTFYSTNRGYGNVTDGTVRALQSTKYLLELGKFHRLSGIPHDYFGVMGTIFVHAVRPYWEEAGCMSEQTEDVWMALFAHIARDPIQ